MQRSNEKPNMNNPVALTEKLEEFGQLFEDAPWDPMAL